MSAFALQERYRDESRSEMSADSYHSTVGRRAPTAILFVCRWLRLHLLAVHSDHFSFLCSTYPSLRLVLFLKPIETTPTETAFTVELCAVWYPVLPLQVAHPL